MSAPQIEFVRLTEIAIDEIVSLLNEPRNRRHLPLAGDAVTAQSAADWVSSKDAQWDLYGYGPWAVLVDDRFAGWGGFQREEAGADLALVLAPAYWGVGALVARAALDRGFAELRLESVLIALPRSRSSDRAVARLGFRPDGDVEYGGVPFRQYRLDRDTWQTHGAETGDPPAG